MRVAVAGGAAVDATVPARSGRADARVEEAADLAGVALLVLRHATVAVGGAGSRLLLLAVTNEVFVDEVGVACGPPAVLAAGHLASTALVKGEVVAEDGGPLVLLHELQELTGVLHGSDTNEVRFVARYGAEEDGEVDGKGLEDERRGGVVFDASVPLDLERVALKLEGGSVWLVTVTRVELVEVGGDEGVGSDRREHACLDFGEGVFEGRTCSGVHGWGTDEASGRRDRSCLYSGSDGRDELIELVLG